MAEFLSLNNNYTTFTPLNAMPGRKRDAYDERFVNFRRNIL